MVNFVHERARLGVLHKYPGSIRVRILEGSIAYGMRIFIIFISIANADPYSLNLHDDYVIIYGAVLLFQWPWHDRQCVQKSWKLREMG